MNFLKNTSSINKYHYNFIDLMIAIVIAFK